VQRSRPHNSRDGLLEATPERELLQGGRPHNPHDGLI